MLTKSNFRIALSSAGMTQMSWAKEQGVSQQAVGQMFTGRTRSKRLKAAMEQFIYQEFEKLRMLPTPSKEVKAA